MKHALSTVIVAAAIAIALPALAAPPAGCTPVKVTIPGISPNLPDNPLTWRGYGADAPAMQACNPPALVTAGETNMLSASTSPTAGSRTMLRTKVGFAVINLPSILKDGDVHQVLCVAPAKAGDPPTFRVLRRSWQGGVPEELILEDKTAAEAADAAVNLQGCIDAMPPQMRAAFNPPPVKTP